jgi:hypothetical protein
MSNLVFSDKLSLGDAIAAAGKYKSKFKASELENAFQVDVEGLSEHNRHNLTREPVYHHFDSMRTQSTCSHAHRMQLYVL